MAAPRKTAKSVAAAAETVKAEAAAPKAEVKKTEEAAPKAEKKTTARKTTAKRTTTKKAEQNTVLHVQFSGKSYSQEELVKMAQDVWKYDLKQKAKDLTSIELYVKPEESTVYYVMNHEMSGSFLI